MFTRSWNKKKKYFQDLKIPKKVLQLYFSSNTSLWSPPTYLTVTRQYWIALSETKQYRTVTEYSTVTKYKTQILLKYTRWNTGLDTCYTVCHVFCEIHFNMKTVELHYIDILNSHKRWSDSLWLTYKYTGGWNRLCIPLLPVTPLFTFSGLSDTQKSFSVISSWKCFSKWKNYSICHNTTH